MSIYQLNPPQLNGSDPFRIDGELTYHMCMMAHPEGHRLLFIRSDVGTVGGGTCISCPATWTRRAGLRCSLSSRRALRDYITTGNWSWLVPARHLQNYVETARFFRVPQWLGQTETLIDEDVAEAWLEAYASYMCSEWGVRSMGRRASDPGTDWEED